MKTTLRISLLLNVALPVCLVYSLVLRRPAGQESSSGGRGMQDPIPSAAQPTGAAPASALPASAPQPFRWSQLESSDYRVYVANLKAIGCPEQTVRDIIQADVEGLYSARRRQMGLDGTGPGPWSREEEASLVAGLLVETGPSIAEATPSPVTPLVFQKLDLAALKLNSGQMTVIEELRARFIEQIGGPGQDRSDPGYAERWRKAETESDEMLRGMIGGNAFQNYQLEAAGADMRDEKLDKP
jgi:hypothetical protein